MVYATEYYIVLISLSSNLENRDRSHTIDSHTSDFRCEHILLLSDNIETFICNPTFLTSKTREILQIELTKNDLFFSLNHKRNKNPWKEQRKLHMSISVLHIWIQFNPMFCNHFLFYTNTYFFCWLRSLEIKFAILFHRCHDINKMYLWYDISFVDFFKNLFVLLPIQR